jgi:hypothetical protein
MPDLDILPAAGKRPMIAPFQSTQKGRFHMTTIKQVALVAAGILCALLFPIGAMPAGAATASSEAAYKAATDTDPHLPLTPYQQQMLELKDRTIANARSGKTSAATTKAGLSALGVSSASALSAAATTSAGMPSSESVAKNQTPQKTGWWCGPATVHEALGQLHHEYSQAFLAARLGTTESGGTAWSGGPTATGHPVPDVLNKYQSFAYLPQEVSMSPGDQEIERYKNRLTGDIWLAGAPVIANAWTTKYSEFWLVGHPQRTTVKHWFDIYGYQVDSGGTTWTKYEDSVHGVPASMISWAPGVPAYSQLPSHRVAHIVGGRGYVW